MGREESLTPECYNDKNRHIFGLQFHLLMLLLLLHWGNIIWHDTSQFSVFVSEIRMSLV